MKSKQLSGGRGFNRLRGPWGHACRVSQFVVIRLQGLGVSYMLE